MKLRNKKTGEIATLTLSIGSLSSVLKGGYGRKTLGGCHWEYVDEPEVVYPSNDNELVIHFENSDECQEFYNKLLAWKRLKGKGFKFDNFVRNAIYYVLSDEEIEKDDVLEDLDLLFGGEE